MQWNPQVLDEQIAAGISTFRKATIPDLRGKFPQAQHWAAVHFLNSVLRGAYPHPARQLAIGFLRWTGLTIEAYHDARRETLEYLDGNDPHNPRIGKYYAATSRWEVFALKAGVILDLFKNITGGRGTFIKGDLSRDDRLYHIANKVKHVGDDMVKRPVYTIVDSVPVWLSDDGVNTVNVLVTYGEAADFVGDVVRIAEMLPDPKALFESANKPVNP